MTSVAAVILAAGDSSRLGEPKQLVVLAGERLLERAVRVASEAGCAPVVLVLGASAERIVAECALDAATVVMNEAWASGMASSIRVGITRLEQNTDLRIESSESGIQSETHAGVDGVILMTCDQPAVTADHLQRLMSADEPVASSYAGRRGVPACFPRRCFAELLLLKGDAGAKALLQASPAVELAGGELDIDTQETLEDARAISAARLEKQIPADDKQRMTNKG